MKKIRNEQILSPNEPILGSNESILGPNELIWLIDDFEEKNGIKMISGGAQNIVGGFQTPRK